MNWLGWLVTGGFVGVMGMVLVGSILDAASGSYSGPMIAPEPEDLRKCSCGSALSLVMHMESPALLVSLACVGPSSCGYRSNEIEIEDPKDLNVDLMADFLIRSMRTELAPVPQEVVA